MKIAVVIGPEGGLDQEEVSYLVNLGFTPCALGPRILRTETAAMYVLSAISYDNNNIDADLKKAKEREHILEGLKTALDFIDEVIAILAAEFED